MSAQLPEDVLGDAITAWAADVEDLGGVLVKIGDELETAEASVSDAGIVEGEAPPSVAAEVPVPDDSGPAG